MTRPPAKRTRPKRECAEAKTRPELHRDVYPIGRISTEFFLRSFELADTWTFGISGEEYAAWLGTLFGKITRRVDELDEHGDLRAVYYLWKDEQDITCASRGPPLLDSHPSQMLPPTAHAW